MPPHPPGARDGHATVAIHRLLTPRLTLSPLQPADTADLAASTDVGNTASARVLEKLGFTRTRRGVVGGLDTVFYHLTRPSTDWVHG